MLLSRIDTSVVYDPLTTVLNATPLPALRIKPCGLNPPSDTTEQQICSSVAAAEAVAEFSISYVTGRFAVVNPTFMQMFGLSDELDIHNVNNQDWSRWKVYREDLELLHFDDHPVRKAVITGKHVKSQLVAVRNPGANELTWMLVNAEPILKENGQIHRVICTYQDITQRRRV